MQNKRCRNKLKLIYSVSVEAMGGGDDTSSIYAVLVSKQCLFLFISFFLLKVQGREKTTESTREKENH